MSRRDGSLTWMTWSAMAALLVALSTSSVSALTVEELQSLRVSGVRITLIDIRSNNHYADNHIVNAINIPFQAIALKKLPPFGRVVVYGRGLDDTKVRSAVEDLNQKEGIQAEALEGGFLAWQSKAGQTTKGGGLFDERLEMIVYDDFVKAVEADEEAVIIDLRPETGRRRNEATGRPVDLGERFPGRRVIERPAGANTRGGGPATERRGRGSENSQRPLAGVKLDPDRLYIIIDGGDGRAAEQVARRLRVRGIGRVAILIGGDIALATEGRPGQKTIETKLDE